MSNIEISINGLDYEFPQSKLHELYDWLESNGGKPMPIEDDDTILPEHDISIIEIIKTMPDTATISELFNKLVDRENKRVARINTKSKPINKSNLDNLPEQYEPGGEL